MQVSIKGKKIEIGKVLRATTEEKIRELVNKYSLNPVECHIVISHQGPMIRSEIDLHLGRGVYVRAHHESDDAYKCIEQNIQTLEKRLRRYKKRLIDHQKKRDIDFKKSPAMQYVISSEQEEEENKNPLIIAELKADIPTLSVSEAVMHMDLADSPIILFHNEAHEEINVVYRRPDGNIGWIAPSSNS